MADQNYGDSQQAVQVFYDPAAVISSRLVPGLDLASVAGTWLVSLSAGSNRYTVTGIGVACAGSSTAAAVLRVAKYPSWAGSGEILGTASLDAMYSLDVSRIAVSVDLLPGEVLAVQSQSGSGTVSITFDGYTSNFGSTEGEVEKPSGGKVINVTGVPEITPVVLIAELPEESGDE